MKKRQHYQVERSIISSQINFKRGKICESVSRMQLVATDKALCSSLAFKGRTKKCKMKRNTVVAE